MRANPSVRLRVALAGAVAVAAAAVALGMGIGSPAASPVPATQEVHFGGYPLSKDLPTVAGFPGTRNVVVGTVESVGTARWNTPDLGRPADFGDRTAPSRRGGRIYQVSSPLTVRVDRVLFGSMTAGESMVVRALGGERDGVKFSFETQPPVSFYEPGKQYVFFLARPVDAGDGIVASTPNQAYAVDRGVARIWSGEYSVPVQALVDAVARARKV